MKGEKPPAPTRGIRKRSAVRADDDDDVDDVEPEVIDAADSAAELVPRTDIRFAVAAVDVI